MLAQLCTWLSSVCTFYSSLRLPCLVFMQRVLAQVSRALSPTTPAGPTSGLACSITGSLFLNSTNKKSTGVSPYKIEPQRAYSHPLRSVPRVPAQHRRPPTTRWRHILRGRAATSPTTSWTEPAPAQAPAAAVVAAGAAAVAMAVEVKKSIRQQTGSGISPAPPWKAPNTEGAAAAAAAAAVAVAVVVVVVARRWQVSAGRIPPHPLHPHPKSTPRRLLPLFHPQSCHRHPLAPPLPPWRLFVPAPHQLARRLVRRRLAHRQPPLHLAPVLAPQLALAVGTRAERANRDFLRLVTGSPFRQRLWKKSSWQR